MVADAAEPSPGFRLGLVDLDPPEALGVVKVGVAAVDAGVGFAGAGAVGWGLGGEGAAEGEVHVEGLGAEGVEEDLLSDLEGEVGEEAE